MNLSHLKQLLAKNGISQTDLARLLRRDKAVITNLFQGKRQLKAEEAMVIASHIGVPVAQILGVNERGFAEPAVLIPFQSEPEMNKRAGGVVKKDGKFYLEANDRSASPKAYALEVADDSMNLAGIMKGDIVISELDRPCKHGQIVIAQHYQGRGAKTIIRKYEPPLLLPYSTLSLYKPLRMDDTNARVVSPVLKLIRTY